MALTPKNDVTQIFAEDAPAEDKPASFPNYPSGWDSSRPNGSRPTIKQSNYLQQRTDQNILYIHEHGAGLPYDSKIQYADGAIVLKEGVLQQLVNGVWQSANKEIQLEINNKADKATTLGGYGIADAYTKNRIDADFAKKADVPTNEQFALKANKADVYTKSTIDADIYKKTDIDVIVGAISTQATKFYPTLAQANADIASLTLNQPVQIGEVANGGLWYKASTNAVTLTKSPYDTIVSAKQYSNYVQNISNASVPTGTGSSVATQFAITSDFEKLDSVSAGTSYTAKKASVAMINSATIDRTVVTKQSLTATINSVVTILETNLKSRDVILNGALKSKFSAKRIVDESNIELVGTAGSDMMRASFYAIATPNSNFATLAACHVYANNAPSVVQNNASTMTENYAFFGHSGGYLALNIKNSYLTGLGYPLTTAGIKKWFADVLKSSSIEYYTTIESSYPCLPSVALQVNDVATFTNPVDVYAPKEESKTMIDAAYTEFKCDVDNNSAYNFTNYPIELKVDLDCGLVNSDDYLLVEDQNGVAIPAQFEQARNNNVRKEGRIGQFVDGSFKTGSIWISDSINANAKKDYVLKLKKQTASVAPVLSKITGGYSIDVNGYVYTFNDAQALLLSSVKVLTVVKNYLSSAVCREVNLANTGFSSLNFTLEPIIKLISSGAVFSEVEVVVYNQAGAKLGAKDLKLTVTYMLFKSGKMRVKTLLSATKDIPQNTLAGYTLYHQLNIANGTRSNAYGSALLTATEAALASPISVVMTVVNGDIHRDGQEYGASRPSSAIFSASTASLRTSMGWDIGTIGQTSLVNYGVPKNWTWTTEVWANFTETQSTAELASKACVNRPVGFLGKTINKFFAQDIVKSKMITDMRGYYNAVTAPEASVIGGISRSSKTNYHYPTLFDLTETLMLDKSIDTVWTNFVAYMNRNYKPDGQAEIDLKSYYLDGRMSSQYIWYRVLCPIQYFYQFAVKQGKSNIVDTCKLWIGQYCEAVKQMVDTIGWFPLTPTILSPAANANSTGVWATGMAINMGFDYNATFNALEALVTDPTANGRWLPIAMDTMDSADNIAKQRWMRYEGIINYMFTEGHVLANKTSKVDMTNNFIRFSNGDGNLSLIDACLSESRRGAFQEPIEILHACVRKNTKSSLNLAYAIAKNYELYAPYDLLKSNRMYDVETINSSWNSTTKQVDTFSFLFCKPVLDILLQRAI